jgi:hypothetical protein
VDQASNHHSDEVIRFHFTLQLRGPDLFVESRPDSQALGKSNKIQFLMNLPDCKICIFEVLGGQLLRQISLMDLDEHK